MKGFNSRDGGAVIRRMGLGVVEYEAIASEVGVLSTESHTEEQKQYCDLADS